MSDGKYKMLDRPCSTPEDIVNLAKIRHAECWINISRMMEETFNESRGIKKAPKEEKESDEGASSSSDPKVVKEEEEFTILPRRILWRHARNMMFKPNLFGPSPVELNNFPKPEYIPPRPLPRFTIKRPATTSSNETPAKKSK